MIRVIIVSDVQVYREAVAYALSRDAQFDTIEATFRPREALNLIRRRSPQVALVDLAIAKGLSALKQIALSAPRVARIALAVDDRPREIIACAEAGASGYLTREASISDLAKTIDAAAHGRLTCSPRIAQVLFDHIGQLAAHPARNGAAVLTEREQEILDLIETGQSNKSIARQLGIEVSTVKNHVHNMLAKLGVRRRGEAAALCRRSNGSAALDLLRRH